MHIDADYSGGHACWHWYSQVPYVGDYVNDKIFSIHIHYAP
ncbi:hypothetical protein [Plantactinospora endophytica]|uniref:Uncharacterized protein n=1 Tax=Plantactinospora endophytica TaxID=673535 RepID=A0ABQ4EF11_9ACTN|nr:hypothetical protein [Plantactinospora endophytica]GIG93260.1 hypothetical protein Pen02_81960 [Plantactinospora endophytica]